MIDLLFRFLTCLFYSQNQKVISRNWWHLFGFNLSIHLYWKWKSDIKKLAKKMMFHTGCLISYSLTLIVTWPYSLCRACTIALFSPLLKRIGYGLTWRSATVMAWGGLRGAVGLALALTVSQNEALDTTFATQDKVCTNPTCSSLKIFQIFKV